MNSRGDCFYCQKPVMADDGQSIKYLIRTSERTQERQEWPTHKQCRKNAGV